MKHLTFIVSICFLLLGTLIALAKNKQSMLNEYWFKLPGAPAQPILVEYTCYPFNTGCLITEGPFQGAQLYTSKNLATPLGTERGK